VVPVDPVSEVLDAAVDRSQHLLLPMQPKPEPIRQERLNLVTPFPELSLVFVDQGDIVHVPDIVLDPEVVFCEHIELV